MKDLILFLTSFGEGPHAVLATFEEPHPFPTLEKLIHLRSRGLNPRLALSNVGGHGCPSLESTRYLGVSTDKGDPRPVRRSLVGLLHKVTV